MVVLVVSLGRGWTLVDGTAKDRVKVAATALVVMVLQLALEFISRRYEVSPPTFQGLVCAGAYLLS